MNIQTNQIIKIITIASLILLFVVLSEVSSVRSFAKSTGTPPLSTSPTNTVTTIIETPTATLSEVPTSQDLLNHFEKVTTSMLTVATIVIGVLGALGGLGIYLGRVSFSEMGEQVDRLKNRISDMELTQEKLNGEITRAENLSQSLLNRYRYLIECRDAQPNVRIRAIQQLGESNDIAAISLISEMLSDDGNAEVRAEAAFVLGNLLITGGVENGSIDVLIAAISDRSFDVRLQAIQTIDNLICNRINLPRKAYAKLEKVAASKTKNNIIEACKTALKHKQQVMEGSMTNVT